MNHRTVLKTLVFSAAAFLIAAPLFAQGQQSQQGTQQQSQQQTAPPQQTQKPSLANPQQNALAAPVDPKEEAAYKAFYDMNPSSAADFQSQIQAGEKFQTDYPQSRYREAVYGRLANAYFKVGQIDKMCDAADKALAIQPDDLTVLTQVGWMIPHVGPGSTPNYDQDLAKGEQYEKHALEVLNTLPKPANLTQAEFEQTKNAAIQTSYSGLGLIHFRQKKFELSSTELAQATTVITDSDPTDFLVLGIDDENLQKYADSVKAFDTCAQMPSSLQGMCKQGSAEAKSKEGAAPPHKP